MKYLSTLLDKVFQTNKLPKQSIETAKNHTANQDIESGALRDKLFIKLIDTVIDEGFGSDMRIVSIDDCQLRITVDGYADDENRFLGVNSQGNFELIWPNGKIGKVFNSIDEVRHWFNPPKDNDWELALKNANVHPNDRK